MLRALLFSFFLLTPVFAQEIKPIEDALTGFEKSLDQRATNDTLQNIKDAVVPLLDKVSGVLHELDPKLEEAKTRLEQLTPVIEKDKPAPLESDEAKKIREIQAGEVGKLDAQVKQYKLAQVRGEQILQKITDKKRALFTAQLFEQHASLFDQNYWRELSETLPSVVYSVKQFAQDSYDYTLDHQNYAGYALIFLLFLGLIYGQRMIHRFVFRHAYHRLALNTQMHTPRVLSNLIIFLENFLPLFCFMLLFIWGLKFTNLFPIRWESIFSTLPIAFGIYILTNALSLAVLTPNNEAKRLIEINDDVANALHKLLKSVAFIIAFGMMALAINKMLYMPINMTILMTGIISFCVAFVVFSKIASPALNTLRIKSFLWLFALIVIFSEVFGYGALAIYLSFRLLLLALIIYAAILIYALYEAFFQDFLIKTQDKAQTMAASLGVKASSLELFGAIVGGMLKLILVIVGFILLLGPWGMQTSDYSARLDDALFGLRLGDIHQTLGLLLGAMGIFGFGLYLTKIVQRWFSDVVLPRTSLDKGLQDSLITIFGYCGFVIVFIGALTLLGVNLGSITILAGALSVGIGFGLQSIVSNFVSGLILLAERPIRIGDSIVVRGEAGHVRKISVRSTEIETFERATVILPNSELISGVVKNWTHTNRYTRTIVTVRVAYDSDVDIVEAALLEAANVKNVLKDPPPKVYLVNFGDNGLEFELRAVISNVDKLLSSRSDIYMNILRKFRDEGIIISPPEQRVQTPAPKKEA